METVEASQKIATVSPLYSTVGHYVLTGLDSGKREVYSRVRKRAENLGPARPCMRFSGPGPALAQ